MSVRLYGTDDNGDPAQIQVNENGEIRVATVSAALTSAPVVGSKTVSNVAAEIFAGTSRLEGRYSITVYNEGHVNVYWGASNVSVENGYPLLPGDAVTLTVSPHVEIPIFMVAETNVPVRVVELG